MKRTHDNMSAMDVVASSAARRPFKRPRSFSGRGRGAPLSKRQRTEVSKIVHRNQELKYVVASLTATAITSTAGVVSTPFDVAQGDTDTTRDGDRLMWAGHIDLSLEVTNGQGSLGDVTNMIRVVLFQWVPISVPTAGDVFLAGPSGVADCFSHYNHDQRQQFKILFDRLFKTAGSSYFNGTFESPTTAITSTGVKRFKVSLAKANKQSQYAGGSTVGTNKIYMFYVSDSSAVTHPTLAYSTKIVFRDG